MSVNEYGKNKMEDVHYILITHGTKGDIIPFISLGRTLKQLSPNCGITILSNECWRKLCEVNGFEFYSIAPADPPQDKRDVTKFIRGNIRKSFGSATEWIINNIQRWRNPIVFSLLQHRGADIARDILEFRHFRVCLQPYTLFSSKAPPRPWGTNWELFEEFPRIAKFARWYLRYTYNNNVHAKMYNDLRKRYRLEPIRDLAAYQAVCGDILCLFPEWFLGEVGAANNYEGNLHFCGFPPPIGAEGMVDLDEVKYAASDVVISLGTGISAVPWELDVCLSVCRNLELSATIIASNVADITKVDKYDVNIIKQAYLPRLLNETRIFVHHGGMGVVSEGLRAGVKQIILPRIYDQHDNAERVQRLGVGVNISKPSLHRKLRKEFKSSSLEMQSSVARYVGEIEDSDCGRFADRVTKVIANDIRTS